MTTLKTTTVPLSLVLLGIITALCHGAEPAKEPEIKYSFSNSSSSIEWQKTDQPSILPSHLASFSVIWHHRKPTMPKTETVLQTAAGKSITPLQREFVKTRANIASASLISTSSGALSGIKYTSKRTHYTIYAVSKEDARKMAEAFIEVFLKENRAASKPQLDTFVGKLQDQRAQYRQDIEDIRQKTPDKEQTLKDLQVKLEDLKKAGWYQGTDQAMQAKLELNTILNTESIELAGLQAKRKAIERHRDVVEKKITNQTSSLITSWQPILLSLEQKYIDLMIDLDVAKAREETALTLRSQAQAYLDLSTHVSRLSQEVRRLKPDLSRLESDLTRLENLLAQSLPVTLPLQIRKNEVGIRPVTVKIVE